MLRFQLDRAIMVKRWRAEWEKHGRDFGNCHCGAGIGTMRKSRPYGSHAPNQHCRYCEIERQEKRLMRKRQRASGRKIIALETEA